MKTKQYLQPALVPEVYPTEGGLCGSLLGTQRCGTHLSQKKTRLAERVIQIHPVLSLGEFF